jgi:hypothetical protein
MPWIHARKASAAQAMLGMLAKEKYSVHERLCLVNQIYFEKMKPVAIFVTSRWSLELDVNFWVLHNASSYSNEIIIHLHLINS